MLLFLATSCFNNSKTKNLLDQIPADLDIVVVGDAKTIIESAGGTIEESQIILPSYLTDEMSNSDLNEYDKLKSFLKNSGIDVNACAIAGNYSDSNPIVVFALQDQNKFTKTIEENDFREKDTENGVIYYKKEKLPEFKDKFVITMIGRYSNEKRQDVLIDAVLKSKYTDKIQLVLAGKGPKETKYKKLGNALKNKPVMKFYSKDELISLLKSTDLYVHSADAEIEAISCIEAFACGNVPIIANSKNSATKQFALVKESLFEAGNSDDLANKIDFWIENESYRKEMELKYSQNAEKYRLKNSIIKMEEMFKDAIREYK